MRSYKATVSLATVVPNDGNPRKDFGDIDALARSILATGGQPVCPIVVVPDGARYRLVDGERRYRAMCANGAQACDAIVFTDMADAEAAVAMMATDDSKPLDGAERRRGFQTMLALGVDDGTVAGASGLDAESVRKVRRVVDDAPEQATLDQMIAAAEFDGDERMEVLKAKGDRWQARAEQIRRRHEEARKRALVRAAIDELGIEVVDDRPDGYAYGSLCYEPEDPARMAEGKDVSKLRAWEDSWAGWRIASPLPANVRKETEEEREERLRLERERKAWADLKAALVVEAATTDVMPTMQRVAGRLRRDASPWKVDNVINDLLHRNVRKGIVDAAVAEPMSMWELISFLVENNIDHPRFVAEMLPAAIEDAYDPSEDDLWLLEVMRARVAEREGESK